MHQKNPEKFQIGDIYYHTLSNVVAGAETTGISLSAALYFLWKHPQVLAKLRQELDEKSAAGKFQDLVPMKQAAECPYLQAVIKETLRLHPGNGLGLPRVVPAGGLILAGRYFPEGVCCCTLKYIITGALIIKQVEVGVNAYVAHANREIFGEDVEAFRPERWLEDQEAVTRMDNYFFTVCLQTISCRSLTIGCPNMYSVARDRELTGSIIVRSRFAHLLGQEC